MSKQRRVLIAGESWTSHTIHQKGFDSFTTTEYAEGVKWLRDALEAGGWEVTYQPAHVTHRDYPFEVSDLAQYDCVMLSDVGANTLLLHPDTFAKSNSLPNRLETTRQYVENGGGLIMIGGYLTFQGIDAKGQYQGTPIETALPVTLEIGDDRVECPQGVTPQVVNSNHQLVNGIDGVWPNLLGYNRIKAKPESEVIVTVGDDPLIVLGNHGKGRSVAFASDCGPHWAPPSFVDWSGYAEMWQRMTSWAAGE
tara:strand:+ start:1515 stop:2270 length:756 start_codon:yes stop_codon:yes gene_type:complete